MNKCILFIFLLVSCNGNTPSNILNEKKMKAILIDLSKADEFVNTYLVKDSTKNIKIESINFYKKIFAFHKTDRKIFLESFDYYLSNPAKAKDMFDSLSVQTRRLQNDIHKIPIDTPKLVPKAL